ncbi:50S ribosomal protein L18 [Candidatus Saccharibacteria bacterium]|nr:50S ribosomal protein L18 [Candidatus Saccharibacteria bacterium]
MDYLKHKKLNRARRANRVRAVVVGTATRPRMTINISNAHVTAQIIDDTKSQSLVYATTVGQKVSGTLTEKAIWVGSEVAKKAAKAKISKVVFDRGSRKFHGRIKALAEAARSEGLEF